MKQRVRILRDFPMVELIGRQLGPFTVGEEVELEVWEAVVLVRHGFAELEPKITVTELRKLQLAEERTLEPAPLPAGFYASLTQHISDLRAANQPEEIGELRAAVAALAEVRTQKLVRAMISSVAAENLPPEERSFVNRFMVVLEDWNNWLESLFEKEEVGKNGKFGGAVRHAVGGAPDIQKQGVPAPDVHASGTAAP